MNSCVFIRMTLFSFLFGLYSIPQDFQSWVEKVDPEHSVPECWDTDRPLSKSITSRASQEKIVCVLHYCVAVLIGSFVNNVLSPG